MIDKFWYKYDFLSNFHPAKIMYEGIEYPTTEHAFQAAKTLDKNIRMVIASASTPGKAKRAGRNVELRPDWEDVKISIMKNICRIKFQQPKFMSLLLDTGDEELVEGNTWGDKIWGVCDGEGENNLGKILMEIRNELGENYDG